jgi:hypothetical protein
LVFLILIFNFFKEQKDTKAFSICYKLSADDDISTASSAKASKNNCKVAISSRWRWEGFALLSYMYFST